MTEVIGQGLTALIERTLDDIFKAKKRGEDDLYQYTKKYFSAIHIAEDFLSNEELDNFWEMYKLIMDGNVTDFQEVIQIVP